MKVIERGLELSNVLKNNSGVRGLVPTMGALHSGHISLVNYCREACDQVVVSVFVNPTQFNDPADLTSYPRTPEADLEQLQKAGVDVVYMPTVEDIYPEPDTRQFDFGTIDKVMEGQHRPGHFNGVAQVVSRLFDIVKCDRAYFGEKDFQQLAVVRALVDQLNYAVEIVGCPTIREKDGLALSSRNILLEPQYRKEAPVIYKVLQQVAVESASRSKSVQEVQQSAVAEIERTGLLKVEYLSIVHASTLESVENWQDSPMRCCVAVQAGKVRLIDNIALTELKS